MGAETERDPGSGAKASPALQHRFPSPSSGARDYLGFSREAAFDTRQRAGDLGVSTSFERVPSPFHFLQNILGFGGPQKGLGMAVVLVNIVADRGLQFRHIMKHSAPHTFLGEIAEEPFHLVEP